MIFNVNLDGGVAQLVRAANIIRVSGFKSSSATISFNFINELQRLKKILRCFLHTLPTHFLLASSHSRHIVFIVIGCV